MQVEWYAANPCFHPIPPGYGLPWGTPAAKRIPEPLIFEAEFALAKSQLETQTPKYEYTLLSPAGVETQKQGKPGLPVPPQPNPPPTDRPADDSEEGSAIKKTSHAALAMPASSLELETVADGQFGLPPDWPDPSGLIPSPPRTAAAMLPDRRPGAASRAPTTATIRSSPRRWQVTTFSATTPDSEVGRATWSGAKTSSGSAATCIFGRHSARAVGPEKPEWCGDGRISDNNP